MYSGHGKQRIYSQFRGIVISIFIFHSSVGALGGHIRCTATPKKKCINPLLKIVPNKRDDELFVSFLKCQITDGLET